MRRYEIESFYLEPISEELVSTDNDGKRRAQIRQYELYTRDDSELRRKDIIEAGRKLHATDRRTLLARKKFLHRMFTVAGLANDQFHFLADVVVENQTLSGFADFCTANSEKIARWFEMEVRKDLQNKPAQQLGRFLKMHGVTWKRKSKKVDGQKIYRYLIPQVQLDELEAVVAKRRDNETKENWHQERNTTTTNRLFPPEPDIDPADLELANELGVLIR